MMKLQKVARPTSPTLRLEQGVDRPLDDLRSIPVRNLMPQ